MSVTDPPPPLKLLLCRYHLTYPWAFHSKITSSLYKEILSYVNNAYFVRLKGQIKRNATCWNPNLPEAMKETRIYKSGDDLILGPCIEDSLGRHGTSYPKSEFVTYRNGSKWDTLQLSCLHTEDTNGMSILLYDQDVLIDRVSVNSVQGRQIIAKKRMEKFFEDVIQPEGYDDPIPDSYWSRKETVLDTHSIIGIYDVVQTIDREISSIRQDRLESNPDMAAYVDYTATITHLDPNSELAHKLALHYRSKGCTVRYLNSRIENDEDVVDARITSGEWERREGLIQSLGGWKLK